VDPKRKSTGGRAGRKRDEERDADIAAVHAEETSDARIPGGERRPWTGTDDDLTLVRRGRHDQGYVPKGHVRAGNWLLARADLPDEHTPVDRVLALAVIEGLKKYAAGVPLPRNVRDACRALFKQIRRHPFGEAWRSVLADLLRSHATAREAARIGVVSPGTKEMSATEILGLLRLRFAEATRFGEPGPDETPPEWLNAAAIEDVLGRVNLGGAGGRGKKRGKSPERCVDWLVETYATRARKPRP